MEFFVIDIFVDKILQTIILSIKNNSFTLKKNKET